MDSKLIIYYLCILTGAVVSALEGYYLGKKQNLSVNTLKIYISLALVIGIFSAFIMGQLQNFIMSLTGLPYYPSRMRIFGGLLFTPLLIYYPVKHLAGDFLQVTEIFTPGTYLLLGFSKIGCAVYGCCYGVKCSFGVPTPFEEHLCFPVQLLESLMCIIIFFVMHIFVTKIKHRKGIACPAGLILYGVVRFFVEFLRYYPEAERTYFLGMSFWQAVSIITVIIGAVWLIYIHYGNSRGLQKRNKPCEE